MSTLFRRELTFITSHSLSKSELLLKTFPTYLLCISNAAYSVCGATDTCSTAAAASVAPGTSSEVLPCAAGRIRPEAEAEKMGRRQDRSAKCDCSRSKRRTSPPPDSSWVNS